MNSSTIPIEEDVPSFVPACDSTNDRDGGGGGGALEDITNASWPTGRTVANNSTAVPEKKRACPIIDSAVPSAPHKNFKVDVPVALNTTEIKRDCTHQDENSFVASVSVDCVVCRGNNYSCFGPANAITSVPPSSGFESPNAYNPGQNWRTRNENIPPYRGKVSQTFVGNTGSQILPPYKSVASTRWGCTHPNTMLRWLRPANSILQFYTVDNPLYVSEYIQEMHHNLRQAESMKSAHSRYMEKQPEITPRMRSILVDWLVDVHRIFRLVPETLYLAINILDRYLERREVSKPYLQLVGIASLFIACKYEETAIPKAKRLAQMCDEAYTISEIIAMEASILQALDFRCTVPTAYTFLKLYLPCAHADERLTHLSSYILDGTLQSYDLLFCLPSKLASAAIWIARSALGRTPWSPTLWKHACYREKKVMGTAQAILDEKSSIPDELDAVHRKYSCRRCGGVACMDLSLDS